GVVAVNQRDRRLDAGPAHMSFEHGNGPRDAVLGPDALADGDRAATYVGVGGGDPDGLCQPVRVETLPRDWSRARAQLEHASAPEELVVEKGNHYRRHSGT